MGSGIGADALAGVYAAVLPHATACGEGTDPAARARPEWSLLLRFVAAESAGLAVLETIESEGLCQRSAELGGWMQDRLASIESPLVRQVRGRGLMIGIELKARVTPCLRMLQERGVLALPAGSNVLRLLPPLVIEQEQLENAARAIEAVLQELGGAA